MTADEHSSDDDQNSADSRQNAQNDVDDCENEEDACTFIVDIGSLNEWKTPENEWNYLIQRFSNYLVIPHNRQKWLSQIGSARQTYTTAAPVILHVDTQLDAFGCVQQDICSL